MRGQRSKQYRKLMQQYGFAFGFREPYQVLIDVGMLEATVVQFKMDLVKFLSRTLHGEVKPMITQCTIRHLYSLPTTNSPQQSQKPSSNLNFKSLERNATSPPELSTTLTSADKTAIIALAKTFEKRRCEHSPEDPPLSTHACLSSVIDSKDSKTNKHHYVIAVQDTSLREWARGVRGVPSIFVRRSVMIMEPMADVSLSVREGAEREKLRAGVKRKRGEEKDEGLQHGNTRGEETGPVSNAGDDGDDDGTPLSAKSRKRTKSMKQPNPLSAKKPKQRIDQQATQSKTENENTSRKRRRKNKPDAASASLDVALVAATVPNE